MKEEKTYTIIRVGGVVPEDTDRARERNQTMQAVAQTLTLALSSQSNEEPLGCVQQGRNAQFYMVSMSKKYIRGD